MSFYSDVRDAAGQAAYEILEELGEPVTYSNRGATALNLKAAVGDLAKTFADQIGVEMEMTSTPFCIARTLNASGVQIFPPTNGVAVDDEIVWNGNTYAVESHVSDATGAAFVLQCRRDQDRRII